jgi:hypothetical protein
LNGIKKIAEIIILKTLALPIQTGYSDRSFGPCSDEQGPFFMGNIV